MNNLEIVRFFVATMVYLSFLLFTKEGVSVEFLMPYPFFFTELPALSCVHGIIPLIQLNLEGFKIVQ